MSAPIRRAIAGDATAIAELEAAAADHPWSLEAVTSSLSLPSTEAWIAGDPPIGYLVAGRADRTAEILIVGVAPDHRRRGVARALFAAAIGSWRGRVDECFLEVRAGNDPARRLYQSIGFAVVGCRSRYYGDGADAAILRLDVSR